VSEKPCEQSGNFIRKAKTVAANSLRRKYGRADFPGGLARGKYAARMAAGSNIVRLDPDVAEAFPTCEAVNEALGKLLRARTPRRTKRGKSG
jgi:hypothetical protein